jgi:hypothetical protein
MAEVERFRFSPLGRVLEELEPAARALAREERRLLHQEERRAHDEQRRHETRERLAEKRLRREQRAQEKGSAAPASSPEPAPGTSGKPGRSVPKAGPVSGHSASSDGRRAHARSSRYQSARAGVIGTESPKWLFHTFRSVAVVTAVLAL